MDKKSEDITIDRKTVLDRFQKIKSIIINNPQRSFLKFYYKVKEIPVIGDLLRIFSRRIFGAQLHAIKLEVNSYCNQQCITCYIPKKQEDLPIASIEEIFRDIRKYKINVEIIGGEPLMRNDLDDIVYMSKKIARTPRVSLYTNGVLVDEARAQRLRHNGLDAAVVTLHSHIPELHDSITGDKGSWEKTIAGINAFIDVGVKVYTATVVHRMNFEHAEETCAYVEDTLKASAIFTKYIPDSPDSKLMLTTKEWRKVRYWLIKHKKTEHMKEVEAFFSLTGSCPSGNYILAVKSDGSVQPCPFATGINLGSVPEKGIMDIYNDRFENDEFCNLKKIPNQCEPCVLKHMCGGGCRSASYGVYDGICGKDPLCGGPYSEIPKGEKIMEHLPIHF